jgi:arylsulfotransferase ASST
MAAPASGSVELSATPGLRPAFRPAATDYASRCKSHAPLRVSVSATGGDIVSVAGRPEQGGSFATSVRRRAGERVSVRVRSSAGAIRYYHVRCLPRGFPNWKIELHGIPQAQWYVTAAERPRHGGYVAIFDRSGAPIWWRRSPSKAILPWDAKLFDDGLLAYGYNLGDPFGMRKEGRYEVLALDGAPIRVVRTSGSPTDVHDLQRMPNRHLLAITYRRRDHVDLSPYGASADAPVFDGEIQELTPSGRVVWRWNSRDHISPSETEPEWWYDEREHDGKPPPKGHDLLHMNSVEPDGDGLIVSSRHLDAVFRIDRATGDVDWKLGGSFVLGKSLTVLGMPLSEQVFEGQHDARLASDGTLTVYDNRTQTADPPAADRFRIDPVARTATRIEHIQEPDVSHSQWGGSARRLPGGNWVVGWGGTNLVTEQTPAGTVVLALRFGQEHVTYRVQPLLPGRVTAAELRHGMDRMERSRRRGEDRHG